MLVVYIASNEASVLSAKGIADVALFNPTQYPLLIGFVLFFPFLHSTAPLITKSDQPSSLLVHSQYSNHRTAVFAFEGIGLIIPITESMKEPEKFPMVLSWVMAFVSGASWQFVSCSSLCLTDCILFRCCDRSALFAGAGVLSYAAYGSKIQTVVIANLPQRPFVQVVQVRFIPSSLSHSFFPNRAI